MMLRNAWPLMALLLLMHLCSCAALLGIDPIVTEDLVPPTVDEDPALPSVTIEVAGRTRAVHYFAEGPAAAPVVLILHGSLSDSRSMLAFRALADTRRVVFWDQRGNGLSERITAEEFTLASIVEEITAVKALVSPDAPVTLIGHSFGAMFASCYLSQRPDDVERAVLIEPAGLNGSIMAATMDEMFHLDLLDTGLNELLWSSETITASSHATMDYKALQLLANGRLLRYHCDPDHPTPWPVWRPGAQVEVWRPRLLTDQDGRFDYDFAAGLAECRTPVLLVGTDCSALGAKFQEDHHLALFGSVELKEIQGAGHRVTVEKPDELLIIVRRFLDSPSPR